LDPNNNSSFFAPYPNNSQHWKLFSLKVQKKTQAVVRVQFWTQAQAWVFSHHKQTIFSTKSSSFFKKKKNHELLFGSKFELEHHLGFFPTIFGFLRCWKLLIFRKQKTLNYYSSAILDPSTSSCVFPHHSRTTFDTKSCSFFKKTKIEAPPRVQFSTKAIARACHYHILATVGTKNCLVIQKKCWVWT
jgi:hypothetical protein